MIYGTFIEAQGEFARQIAFLSRAVCRDGSRYFLCHISIEASEKEAGRFRGVATDGRRLHIVDPLACPDGVGLAVGNWKPLRIKGDLAWMTEIKSDVGRFPNIKNVIPESTKAVFETTLDGIPKGGREVNAAVHLVKFFREFPDPTAINFNFLYDLSEYIPWTVRWYGKDKALLFENVGYTAVIMPFVT